MTAPISMLDHALAYAARGWRVFPLAGKVPKIKGGKGCLDATTDEATIRGWWKKWPEANIGLATGEASGILVLDIDGDEGEESAKAFAPLPATLTGLTGGGGRHLLFQYPTGERITISQGRLGLRLDTRGEGGYVVAPPSVHPDTGALYEWQAVDVAMAPAPENLLAALRKPEPPTPPPYVPTPVSDGRASKYRASMLAGVARDLADTPKGQRNIKLYTKARRCGEYADACGMTEDEAMGAIFSAIGSAGWDNERLSRKTASNGWNRGIKEPKALPDRPGFDRPTKPGPLPSRPMVDGTAARKLQPAEVVHIADHRAPEPDPSGTPLDMGAAVEAVVNEQDPGKRLAMLPAVFRELATMDAATQDHWREQLNNRAGVGLASSRSGIAAARKALVAERAKAAEAAFQSQRREEVSAARTEFGLDLDGTAYTINQAGVFRYVKDESVCICPRPFFPAAEGRDIATGNSLIKLVWMTAALERAERWCDSSITADRDGLRELAKLGAPLDLQRTSQISAWLLDAQTCLLAEARGVAVTSRLGWIDLKDGRHFILPGDERAQFTGEAKPTRGTPHEWARGIDRLVEMGIAGYTGLVVSGLSAAAPLARFLRKRNPIIGLAAPTGTGKGSVLEYALSTWGDHADFTAQATGSTARGIQNQGKALNDLPYLVDELHQTHKDDPRGAENVLYYLGNGVGRTVADKSGGVIAGHRRVGVGFYASEYALGSLLQGGAQCRVIELEGAPLQDDEQSALLKACARDNPGALAGKLAALVERDQESIGTLAEVLASHIRRTYPSLQGDDHYTIALVGLGLELLEEATGITIPHADITSWLAERASEVRETAADEHQRAWEEMVGLATTAQWHTPDGAGGRRRVRTATLNGVDIAWRERSDGGYLDINPVHPAIKQALREFGGVDRHKSAWVNRGLIERPARGGHIGAKRWGVRERVLRIPEDLIPTENDSGNAGRNVEDDI